MCAASRPREALLARHFFVVTGVGLVLVTLMVLFPALRVGADAVGALLGSASEGEASAVNVADLSPGGADRHALPGAQTFSSRSSLGFPLQVVELRSGGGPWVERRLDDHGQWDQRDDPTLEVRAPGHWPARANPGTRRFVLEPQFALVVRTPRGIADRMIARPSHVPGREQRSSLLVHGPTVGGDAYAFAVTTDARRGEHVPRFDYDLETPYPVRLRLRFSGEREGVQEVHLEELVPPGSLRDLDLVARCAHPGAATRVTLERELPHPAQRLPMPWGEVRLQRGVWRDELEGVEGRPLPLTSIREAVLLHVRCERGCHARVQVLGGSEDRRVEVPLAPGHFVRGHLVVVNRELLPPERASVHCGFTDRRHGHQYAWDPEWSSTADIEIDESGGFEIALPGRGLGPVFEPRTLPGYVRLHVSIPGYHDEFVWLDLAQDPDPRPTIQITEREAQFVLADGHGLAPETLELESVRSLELQSTVLGCAEAKDGRLMLYCLPTRSVVSHRTRRRYDVVQAFTIRVEGAPLAFERGADGAFTQVPTHTRTLRLHGFAFPPGGNARVLLGWTWRGLWEVTHAFDRRRLGTEWEVELTIPDDATSLWWSAGLEPAEEPNAFGGSVPYTRDLERLTIR